MAQDGHCDVHGYGSGGGAAELIEAGVDGPGAIDEGGVGGVFIRVGHRVVAIPVGIVSQSAARGGGGLIPVQVEARRVKDVKVEVIGGVPGEVELDGGWWRPGRG